MVELKRICRRPTMGSFAGRPPTVRVAYASFTTELGVYELSATIAEVRTASHLRSKSPSMGANSTQLIAMLQASLLNGAPAGKLVRMLL
jgi:hypothetical protein